LYPYNGLIYMLSPSTLTQRNTTPTWLLSFYATGEQYFSTDLSARVPDYCQTNYYGSLAVDGHRLYFSDRGYVFCYEMPR
jgi:hypothetical protein